MDIINVSCNLDKFSFYEGINTKEKLGKYLLDRVGYRNTYFCKEGYVVKLEEVLIARYDVDRTCLIPTLKKQSYHF